jgi:hypothetical protein
MEREQIMFDDENLSEEDAAAIEEITIRVSTEVKAMVDAGQLDMNDKAAVKAVINEIGGRLLKEKGLDRLYLKDAFVMSGEELEQTLIKDFGQDVSNAAFELMKKATQFNANAPSLLFGAGRTLFAAVIHGIGMKEVLGAFNHEPGVVAEANLLEAATVHGILVGLLSEGNVETNQQLMKLIADGDRDGAIQIIQGLIDIYKPYHDNFADLQEARKSPKN